MVVVIVLQSPSSEEEHVSSSPHTPLLGSGPRKLALEVDFGGSAPHCCFSLTYPSTSRCTPCPSLPTSRLDRTRPRRRTRSAFRALPLAARCRRVYVTPAPRRWLLLRASRPWRTTPARLVCVGGHSAAWSSKQASFCLISFISAAGCQRLAAANAEPPLQPDEEASGPADVGVHSDRPVCCWAPVVPSCKNHLL